MFSAGARVDIPGDGIQNTLSEFRLAVDVLECFENRNDFIPAVEVQLDISNGLAVESHLRVKGLSHEYGSSKIGVCLIETLTFLTKKARKRSHLRGAFFKETAAKKELDSPFGQPLD